MSTQLIKITANYIVGEHAVCECSPFLLAGERDKERIGEGGLIGPGISEKLESVCITYQPIVFRFENVSHFPNIV